MNRYATRILSVTAPLLLIAAQPALGACLGVPAGSVVGFLPWQTLVRPLVVALAAAEQATADPDDQAATAAEASTAKSPEAKSAKPSSKTTKPKQITVKKQRVRDVVKLKGTFAPAEAKEIAIKPVVWTELKVVRVVPHGKRVRRGTRLVTIDTEKIDDAIRAAEISVKLSDIALQQAKRSLELREKTSQLDLAAARRTKRNADQDLTRFLTIDRAQSEDDAKYSVKSSENMLSYALEELHQLEAMYKADDLTEESEEIVLKRQQDTVERIERMVRRTKLGRDRSLKTTIPRQKEGLEESVRRLSIALDKVLLTLPAGVTKAKLELTKMQLDQKQAIAKLARLKQDRKRLDITAPIEGVVYYGQRTQGNWPAAATVAVKLRPGGTLRPNEVFMTVVKTPATLLDVTIDEKAIGKLRAGLKGIAQPTGYANTKLPVEVTSVSLIPIAPGKFSGQLKVTRDVDRPIMPGMTCSVELTVKDLPNAIAVPAAAVFDDGDGKCVYVVGKDGKAKKRAVTGQQVGKQFVVRRGVKPGTKILTAKPEDAQ
jgi:hypothetical protein